MIAEPRSRAKGVEKGTAPQQMATSKMGIVYEVGIAENPTSAD
jgi:hypothetical protein